MPADDQAWAEGSKIASKNMEQIRKMIGSMKKGGKIKKTGRYKLHKGEEEKLGKKVIRKIKKTGPFHAKKGEHIVTAKGVKKEAARKRSARKRG
jgi:hypothetical protein